LDLLTDIQKSILPNNQSRFYLIFPLPSGYYIPCNKKTTANRKQEELNMLKIKNLLKKFGNYVMENIDLIAPGIIMMNGGYYRPCNR